MTVITKITTGIWICLAFLLLAQSGTTAEMINLVKNPGFEEKETNWITGGKWYGTSKVSIDSEVAHGGKCSLKIAGANDRGIAGQNIFKKDVEAAAGRFSGNYKLEGWIKTYNMETEASIHVEYYTINPDKTQGKFLGGDNSEAIEGTTDWKKVSKTITVPPDCERINLSLLTKHPNGGIAWFDDISFIKLNGKKEASVSQGEKTEIKTNQGNRLPGDSSFETGIGDALATGSCGGTVGIELDPNIGFDGKQSLKLKFHGGGTGDWIRGEPVSTEPGKTYTFSLYARSEREGNSGALIIANTDWKHTVRMPETKRLALTKEWQRLSLTFKAEQTKYWLALFVTPEPGTAWVDAFQFEEGPQATPYKSKEPVAVGSHINAASDSYNVFLLGEEIPIDISCYKAHSNASFKNLTLQYGITDFCGNTVKEGQEKVVLDNQGGFKKTIPFSCNRSGLFVIRTQLRENNEGIKEGPPIAFAVVRPPAEIAKGITPFCGVNGRLDSVGSIRLYFPTTLKKLGMHWLEPSFTWTKIQPEKGKFCWPDGPENPFVLKEQGFQVKALIFWAAPDWACDKKELEERNKLAGTSPWLGLFPADIENWRCYIRELAARYKDAIDIFEIGGEEDLGLGKNAYYLRKYPEAVKDRYVMGPVVTRYSEMIRIAKEEILKVKPDALIGAIRPSGGDCKNFSFSTAVFKTAGKDFNIFPLDCYIDPDRIGPGLPKAGLAEGLFVIFEKALALGKQYGCNQKIYISEMGWTLDVNVAPDSIFAGEQANRLVKMFLISRMTEGYGPCCFWFVLPDYRHGKYNFGLWRNLYPTAALPAYSAVARIVENTIQVKQIDLGPAIKAAVFKKPKSSDAVIWAINPESKTRLKIQTNPSSLSITDMMGNPLPAVTGEESDRKKEITLDLGEFPIYLSKEGKGAFKELSKMLAKARIDIPPVKIASLYTPEIGKAVVHLRNQTTQDLEGELVLTLPGSEKPLTKRVNLPKSNELFPVGFACSLDRIPQDKEIKVEVSCLGYEKVTASFPALDLHKCRKVHSPIRIDGDLSEWAGHPCILMNDRWQIYPPDRISWSGLEDLSAKIYIGWDEDNFYLAAEVQDDVQSNTKSGVDIWNGDCVQFALDTSADACVDISMGDPPRRYDANDYEFVTALAKDGPSFYQYYGPGNVREMRKFAVVRKGDKTFYEASIPFSALTPSHLKKGSVFGFNFVIFDEDGEGVASYFYQLSPWTGKDPRHFKRFMLSE